MERRAWIQLGKPLEYIQGESVDHTHMHYGRTSKEMLLENLDSTKSADNPKRCQACGVAMEYYGNRNGIIGWHTSSVAINSDTSYLCEECRCKEIRGEL